MESKALFVTMDARDGEGDLVDTWLRDAIGPIEQEPDTRDWYAIRFSHDRFAIFDTFEGEVGRVKHLLGKVGRSLVVRTFTQLAGMPNIQMAQIIGGRLPTDDCGAMQAAHVSFSASDGKADALRTTLQALAESSGSDGHVAWYLWQSSRQSFGLLEIRPGGTGAGLAERGVEATESLCSPVATVRTGEVLASKIAHVMS